MENQDENFRRKCLQTHGYKFSDNESDKSQSDEDLRAMKPSPIPYKDFKNRIVKIDNTKKNYLPEAEIHVNRNNQWCNNLKKKKHNDLAPNKTQVEEEKMPSTQDYSKTTNKNGSNSVDKNSVRSFKETTLKTSPVLPTIHIQSNHNLILDACRINVDNIQNKEKVLQPQRSLSTMDSNTKYNSRMQHTTGAFPGSYIDEASTTRTRDRLMKSNMDSVTNAPNRQETSNTVNWTNLNSAMPHTTQTFPITYIGGGSTTIACDRPKMPNMDNQSSYNRMNRHRIRTLEVNNIGERSAINAPDRQETSNTVNWTNSNSTMPHIIPAFPTTYIGGDSTTTARDRPKMPNMDNQRSYSPINRHTIRTLEVNNVGGRRATNVSNSQDISNINNRGSGSATKQYTTQAFPTSYISKPKMPNMDNQANYNSPMEHTTRTFQANDTGETTTNNVIIRQNISNADSTSNSTMLHSAQAFPINHIVEENIRRVSNGGETYQAHPIDIESILNEDDTNSSTCCCILI